MNVKLSSKRQKGKGYRRNVKELRLLGKSSYKQEMKKKKM